jgi:hypothetical protein
MKSRAIELAKKCALDYYVKDIEAFPFVALIESFYLAAYNDGLKRAAEICLKNAMSRGTDCADAIRKEITK